MKTFITFLLGMFLAFEVSAQNVQVFYRDIKTPRQNVLEYQDFGAPIAASTTRVVSGTLGNIASTAVTLSTFTLQPDVPRNLTITPGSTTADVAACTIVVNGTDYKSRAISENFVFAENASSATTGSKAFKSVTSVVFPAGCEDSPYTASWSIGVGEKIGLRQCMDQTADWMYSAINGTLEGTRATITASAGTLSLNTADFNGTMNGASTFNARFIQNYDCY